MANAEPISRPLRADPRCQTPLAECARSAESGAAPEGLSLGFPNGCSHEEQKGSLGGAVRAGHVPAGGEAVGGDGGSGRGDGEQLGPHLDRGGRRDADSGLRVAPVQTEVRLLSAVRVPTRRVSRFDGRYVYVAQDESTGDIKAGVTRHVPSRLIALGRPRLVAVWWIRERRERAWWRCSWSSRSAEIDLHARLHGSLIRGEWFRGDDSALAIISDLRRSRHYPQAVGSAKKAPLDAKERRAWLAVFYAARGRGASIKAAAVEAETNRRRMRAFAELRRALRGVELACNRADRALQSVEAA